MVSLTVPLEESFKAELDSFTWVSWSEVGTESMLKRDIFDKYVKTGNLLDDEWKFCEEIGWHPVDWLPMKKEFVVELKKLESGHFKTAKRLEFWKE